MEPIDLVKPADIAIIERMGLTEFKTPQHSNPGQHLYGNESICDISKTVHWRAVSVETYFSKGKHLTPD
jgi:hypothetical protein